jgi:acetylornithine deacetylase
MTLPAPGDARALLQGLVRHDSRNPSLCPGAPGEGPVAVWLAEVLTSWGMEVTLQPVADGRQNVIARVGPPRGPGRSLMFNGHLDVVDVGQMVHAPFDASIDGDRMYGRGTSDMKGGVAAMCAAAVRAAPQLNGPLIVAGVVDEEYESLGTRALIASGIRADAAIVTEPTRLTIGPAHRGFTWVEFAFQGIAAHGSRYDLGVDAIAHAAALIGELGQLEATVLSGRHHPLLGRPSLHAATISGGTGWSTYPDRCVLRVERRTLPGESPAAVLAEFDRCCDAVHSRIPSLRVTVRHVLTQDPSDVPAEAPIVTSLGAALGSAGLPAPLAGVTAWTDAALLNTAGIPAICFGPGDMGLAHADEEYISLDEVERAAGVLTRLALDWTAAP